LIQKKKGSDLQPIKKIRRLGKERSIEIADKNPLFTYFIKA
jgi:hypothetical protein